jgi:hypothetical protein
MRLRLRLRLRLYCVAKVLRNRCAQQKTAKLGFFMLLSIASIVFSPTIVLVVVFALIQNQKTSINLGDTSSVKFF